MKKIHNGNKDYKFTIHQILCVTGVDFEKKTIYGFVELHILPLVSHLSRIRINSKQCKVFRVCIKGKGLDLWLEATFDTHDPGVNLSNASVGNLNELSRNLDTAVLTTEPEQQGGGEITIRLPTETIPLVEERKPLRLSVEFVLEQPAGGIHFVCPQGEGTHAERRCHIFTYKYGNSSRLWFPCIDTYSEVCTWKIEVTVETGLVVVCPGELVEKVLTTDEKRATHHFTVATPTSACNIAMAIGPFEVVVDTDMPEITSFVLPPLSPLVHHSTNFLSQAFEFFEESLNTQYPFNCYKMVFVDEVFESSQTFMTMSVLNTSLLHQELVIEQTFETRAILVHSLAEQFFGVFVSMYQTCDLWLLKGIAGYLTGLFLKKHFGNNEYRAWLHKELELLCEYEIEGPGLPPIYPYPLAASLTTDNSQEVKREPPPPNAPVSQHPHIIPNHQLQILCKKSHLVMRIIELRIGQDLLLQAFNKSLSLATAAAARRSDFVHWSNMLLSTNGFLKTISTVSGKDINNFLDQWICHSGVAKFNASFNFNRKRNIIELKVIQCLKKGCQKYVGPMTVCIQELDGSFFHTVQVEDTTTTHELPCHSKSRRNKKKKIPLVTGEEVDMDLSVTLDSDSPVLWVRVDPEMTWSRHVTLQQPDYMWQYQLRYERDVTSQIEAVRALEQFPCASTRTCLMDTINNHECFFRVRIEAAHCLAKVANIEVDVWDGEMAMIEMFEKMFGSNVYPAIPKFNDFSKFINYFLQKELCLCISTLKNSHAQCTKKTVKFLLDQLKYNDNRFNKYHDGYYICSLIAALKNTIGPALALASSIDKSEHYKLPTDDEAKAILSVVVRRLNMDQILPSFRYSVTCSCLNTIRCLQIYGHIPAESAIFKKYSVYGLFEDIRLCSIKLVVDFIAVHTSEEDFDWLLDLFETDPVPRIRHHVINCLIEKARSGRLYFVTKTHYTSRIWTWIVQAMNSNYRIRCDLLDLYRIICGKPMNNKELEGKKRKAGSRESSPMLDDSDSKLKLKIKFGEDSVDSGSDFPGYSGNKNQPQDDVNNKKPKKKKKKRHKEKREETFENIPGTFAGSHHDFLDERLTHHKSPAHFADMTSLSDGSPDILC